MRFLLRPPSSPLTAGFAKGVLKGFEFSRAPKPPPVALRAAKELEEGAERGIMPFGVDDEDEDASASPPALPWMAARMTLRRMIAADEDYRGLVCDVSPQRDGNCEEERTGIGKERRRECMPPRAALPPICHFGSTPVRLESRRQALSASRRSRGRGERRDERGLLPSCGGSEQAHTLRRDHRRRRQGGIEIIRSCTSLD